MKKLLYVVSLFLLVVGCNLKPADTPYEGKYTPISSIERAHESFRYIYQYGIDYCSAVALWTRNGKTYVGTAGHCIKRDSAIHKDGKTWQVTNIWCDKKTDICILEINDLLPVPERIIEKNKGSIDIIMGYVSGEPQVLIGEAIPGTSGGGVCDENGEFWGIVSRTSIGVEIIPALRRMGLKYD